MHAQAVWEFHCTPYMAAWGMYSESSNTHNWTEMQTNDPLTNAVHTATDTKGTTAIRTLGPYRK